MTAKHRKGKNNHKHEENFFKNDLLECEARAAGNSYTLALVLVLVVVLGGAIGAWFCFQQHQTLTYLTDNLMAVQMKIAKLQSSHEDLRQSSGKHVSEGLVSRLNALEESYSLAQKQVGMALATAEQLKTSDLPAQVLSLHTEMKTRLAEMQQATVSVEQLGHIQSLVQGKSEEFEGVRLKLEELAALGDGLSVKVEALENDLGAAESKLTEKVAALSASVDGQVAEVLSLREQLEEASLRAEVETEAAPEAAEVMVEEQLEAVLESVVEDSEQADEPQEETAEEKTEAQADEVAPAEPAAAAAEEEVEEAVAEEEPAAAEERAPEEPNTEVEEVQEETTEAQEDDHTEVEETQEEQLQEDATEEETVEEAEDSPAEDIITAEDNSKVEEETASAAEPEVAESPVEREESEDLAQQVEPEDSAALEEEIPETLQDK